MESIVSPILLYGASALGAVGVALALPKRTFSPFIVGALVVAGALGLLFVGMGVSNPEAAPNYNFYIFSGVALLAALRVITHPRPIYSALYFVLTILASCGLYLLLSAEFMAFALVIVYAGAILITYLFVIMLATEGPTEAAVEMLTEYDREAREPLVATLAAALLVGGLTVMMANGSAALVADPAMAAGDRGMLVMPKRAEEALRRAEMLAPGERVLGQALTSQPRGSETTLKIEGPSGVRELPRSQWPAGLAVSDTEGVAFSLIAGHPGAIEIAGVILLMAMLGAVVLARKKVEMDERAKLEAALRQRGPDADDVLGVNGPFVAPGVGEGGARP